jgi:hypothetical protein
MGRKGNKNWLVMGTRRAAIRSATAPIFSKGPGDGLIDITNIPRAIRNKY